MEPYHSDFSPQPSGDVERDRLFADDSSDSNSEHTSGSKKSKRRASSGGGGSTGVGTSNSEANDNAGESALNTSTSSVTADDDDDAEAVRNVEPLLRALSKEQANAVSPPRPTAAVSTRRAKFAYGEYTERGIRHTLDLASAYAPLNHPFTNYTDQFVGCLDYVWHSRAQLRVRRVLEPVREEDVRLTCLPSPFAGSDHTPIAAEFEFIQKQQQQQK